MEHSRRKLAQSDCIFVRTIQAFLGIIINPIPNETLENLFYPADRKHSCVIWRLVILVVMAAFVQTQQIVLRSSSNSHLVLLNSWSRRRGQQCHMNARKIVLSLWQLIRVLLFNCVFDYFDRQLIRGRHSTGLE